MDFKEQAKLFDYDKNQPFDERVISEEKRDGLVVKDVTFAGIEAYLVVPEGEGPFAGVMWGHWLGEEKCNRTQYLDEAIALARSGVVSLLPNMMWSQDEWYQKRVPEEDYDKGIQQVINMRRSMDFLLAQENVDAARIAFVGHDYSGMYGTLMAGVDNRAKAYVFIAVAPSFFDWAFFMNQPKSRVEYIRQNAVLEPTDYLKQIKDASIFFQFAAHDMYIGRTKRSEFFFQAPEPKAIKVYEDADHSMSTEQIREDRLTWLKEQL